METRRLGCSDLDISVIGLGTWAIGGDWFVGWGPQDERDSVQTIIRALECGINWIDTAAVYGWGESERVVGKAVKEFGGPVILATKCGLINEGNGRPPLKCLTAESIRTEVEDSLRRLQAETIDLYQIHWPLDKESNEGIEEAYATLLSLKEEGKIRWAAVSNFSKEQMQCISKLGSVTSLQPPYSMLDRRIESGVLDWCDANNVGVICYSPMECGLLTGKLSHEWVDSLADTDWRKERWGRVKQINYFKDPELSALVAWLEEVSAIVPGKPLSQIAINWVLARQGVTSAIVGARRPEQIEETVKAAEWALSAEHMEAIETSYASYQKRMGRAPSKASAEACGA